MNTRNIANGILRAVLILACILLIGYFLYLIRPVIVYILIAAVVSLIGRPVVLFLRRKLRFPNTLAVVSVMLFLLILVAGIIALFIPLIAEQGKNLSLLSIEDLETNLDVLYAQIMEYFGASPQSISELIKENEWDEGILSGFQLDFIPNILNTLVSILGNLGVGLFSVLFISFFFLKDSNLLQNSLLKLVPLDKEKGARHSLEKIKNLLSRYFLGLLLQILVLFTIYTIVLLLVGIENAVVIAFLCALFNIIPYYGPIIGAAIMVLLTMTSNLGADFSTEILPDVGWVLLGVAIGQLVDNVFSQPVIFSTSVKSHPLEIFLIIIIAGLLFGIAGMILAIPGYTVLKVILKEFLPENRLVRAWTKNL